MSQIIKEGVDKITEGIGHQLWTQNMLQAQMMETLNIMNSNEFNSLMSHMFISMPCYLTTLYLLKLETLNFVPWNPQATLPQISQTIHINSKETKEGEG